MFVYLLSNLRMGGGGGGIVTDLGRYRAGDTVKFVYQPLTAPLAAPLAQVTGPGGPVGSMTLPTRDGTNFAVTIFLGISFPVGTYQISIAGTMYGFTVVPGGDAAGAIIATYATRTVNGWLMVTQVQAGKLTMGRNPRLVP